MSTLINTTYGDYIIRTIAAVGAILITLYADRHPLYKGASFGAFVGTTVITFSWLSTSLPWVYSMFDVNTPHDSLNYSLCHSGLSNGWCMLGYAGAVLSVMNDAGTFALWLYTLYQIARATSTIKLSGAEKIVHALVWIGLSFYLCWTCASILLAIDLHSTDYNALLNIWAYGYLHGCVAFALTAAAVTSFGADQSFRTATWFLNTMLFFTIFPGSEYIARTTVYGGVPENTSYSCIGESMFGTCPSQQAIAAGMIGVAATAVLIHLVSIPMAFLHTQPEYAAGVNQQGLKSVEMDHGNNYDNGEAVVETPVVSTTGQYAV